MSPTQEILRVSVETRRPATRRDETRAAAGMGAP